MKQRRFSDQQLFALRNHMPIRTVIEKILCVPSKTTHGGLRFRCPLCSRFNTAINPSTNLARCFHCETNFNPIDMVMAVKKTGFIEAVSLLKTCKETLSHNEKQYPKMKPPAPCLPSNASKQHRSNSNPVEIDTILSTLIQKEQSHLAEPDKIDSSSHSFIPSARITKLQQDVYRLSKQIDQLKNIINK